MRKLACSGVVLVALLGLSAFPASADYSKRVCGGQDQANGCPVAHDVMVGCNPTEEDAANAACAVIKNGQKTVYPAQVIREGSHGGGSCGYTWYRVTCITGN